MKHNNTYDILIIGSGLGGLISAYILSKNGYKVAVLEKNAQIGGCLQTFQRFGVSFDTGMHYIGSMQEGQILYRLFNYLNLLDLPLNSLDVNGYDVISIVGKEYKYASGYENFVEVLSKSFPERRKEIETYIKSIQEIAQASPLYNMKASTNYTFVNADYVKTSVNEFITSITSDYRLQNVLAGTLPLYAGIKDKTPTYIHALINNFYIQSAYRIVGGSDQIAHMLASSIRSFGGEMYTNSEVIEILCNHEHAIGVRLINDEIITSDYIISDIHPEATIQMIHSPLIRKVYRERIRNLENSISNFTVYIKFKENSVPYQNYNYFYFNNEDVWEANNYSLSAYPDTYLYMHQCHEPNPTYAQSAEIIAYMNFAEVEKWAHTKVGNRGEAYRVFKEEKAQRVLNRLQESFPGILASIESYETSSPLTYRDYTATKNGSMYGIVRDKNFPIQSLVSQRTKIPNVFLTGQNINTHGILGVSIGAIITCAEFLGVNKIMQEMQSIE
ncbi:MAG: NAD(P)/FAD-dependent oxidoreductase [Bacteroidales bacterium]|jgi:all-trans-retinol 13,14-reductase|nr:NAD(P)/FAD-dependent oxidoreductase [Bacteroidales bacterium]MDD2687989.1 NAD(P)/FAD-dependent oxidoreductase [Bacteroidales bacterium]MDD3331133.1 NAD(P)/FAD-dependent oxidoreductase [Bacteroidales bacterium]MDD3692153.1 NAD(P)/FAD-dependent oxidoreductase [Bacteroidales bacterium]MDD4582407.1 NAD(P)/FAD-dependent oxidoreductase [Bacteroidales bacterium]